MKEKTDDPTTLVSVKLFDKIDEPNDESRYLTGWRLALVTISLALGMFLIGVDVSIIDVATQGITTSSQAIDNLTWCGSGYILPHTALQPILDQLIKSFRAQYVYLVSIIIFEAGSILCAAAPTSAALILGRVIAGCGAAGIIQGTLTILGYSVPKKQVPLYYEYVLSVQGISACTSPIIGGIFTERVNWRWCFWVNVPIGAIALLMVLLLVKPKTSHEALWSLPALECLKQMDWIGTLIFRAAFTCLFFALQWGGQTKP